MEVRVNRVELLNEISPMKGVVERRTTIPILSHLMLRATGELLEIAATDLEVSLTSSCDAEVEEEGAVAVQARKMIEIIRASEGEEVTLTTDEQTLTILVGKSRFKIRGLPPEDFPTLPQMGDVDPISITFATFKSMVGKVLYAIPAETARFQLAGALMEPKDGHLALAATDGHRMALVETELEGLEKADGVIVPRKALQELRHLDSPLDLEIRQSDHHLSFTVGVRQLICRILEGAFPDYERVIATDNDQEVVVDRKLLSSVMARVALLTSDRSRALRLRLEPKKLTFSASNPDLGEATEELECEHDGGTLDLGVNPDYMIQFLGAAETKKVRFEMKDENSQCVAYPVDGPERRYVCVIMPIRL